MKLVLIVFQISCIVSVNSLVMTRNMFHNLRTNFSSDLIQSITQGVEMAIEQCHETFKWDRWNCPEKTFSKRSQQLPTKETAYSMAIVSAGIVHAITKNCSRGDLKECNCLAIPPQKHSENRESNKNITTDWAWGGCSDDPTFAITTTKNMFTRFERGIDAHTFIINHNNRVGREIVQKTMVRTCRCHGISGSCSLQTCWMQIARFPEIAMKLKQRYNRAIRISFENEIGTTVLGNLAPRTSYEDDLQIDRNNLVYLEKSPDYCNVYNLTDWPGTKGRICSRSKAPHSDERKSCKNICRSCGYKVKKETMEVNRRCNCTFTWCCEVKCDICKETVEKYFCQ